MFCPQCGQQQAPEVVRFCSRCGFLLDGVLQLLSNGGMLPSFQQPQGPREMSPRKRGVKQGGILLLTGALLVPILGVLASYSSSGFLEVLCAIAAIICFVGGPLRMLYAGLFEEGAPSWPRPGAYMQSATLQSMPVRSALPPPVAQPSPWMPRRNTGELIRPPSVTEGTTRLLDKDDPANRQ
jgi:hypothetical protein